MQECAKKTTWFERALLVALFLACAVALSPNLADADLWGHVQYGRDALIEGISTTTTYSFTAGDYRWINHENLSELILALVATLAGGTGLMVMKCLFGLIVIGLIVHAARRGGSGALATCLVALLVSVNIAYYWSVRPQIFSFVLFALLMSLVMWCFHGWHGHWHLPFCRKLARADDTALPTYHSPRMRCLWLASVIFFVWANTHGGFVAGLCVYTLLLVCRGIEALACHGHQAWGVIRRFTMMISVAVLATLINPYGPGLHGWLIRSLGNPRPEIAEWHAPEWFSMLTLPLLAMVVLAVVCLVLGRRSLDFTHVVVLSVTAWQAVEHQRHVPFFAILFGLWMVPQVQSLLDRFRGPATEPDVGTPSVTMKPSSAGWFGRVLVAGLCVTLVLLVGRLGWRLRGLEVVKDTYPVSAFQYMADQQLRGKLVVTYSWAQYAIAAFGKDDQGRPRMPVAFDGRFRTCYPQEVVDMHFDFVLGNGGPDDRWRGSESPPFDASRALDFGHPDLVLISRYQTHSVQVIEQHRDDWVLLYQDRLAQLWGRRRNFDNPRSRQFIPRHRRRITNEPQVGSVLWPALPVFGDSARG